MTDVPRTMRAAVLAAPGRAELREVATPTPRAGQVVVRLEGCGVCGSNLPAWEGRDWFRYPAAPGAPGHEAWGRVAALGDGVSGLRAGERVTGMFANGFAEYDACDAAQVVPIPPALDAIPFPGEPFSCAVNVARRARVQPGDAVAVVGVGFIGAVALRMAVAAGGRVFALARRPWALALATRLGAAAAIPLDGDPLARLREANGGRLADVAIEAVGLQAPLDLAADAVREQGRLVIAGFHQDGRRTIDLGAWNWKGLDVVNAHFCDPAVNVDGIRAALDAARSGTLRIPDFVTHAFPLDRIGDAFEAMRSRPDGFLKGIVTT